MVDNTLKIGNKLFQRQGKTYICGILNVTPDSFSDGGRWRDTDRALRRVEEMLEEGVDLVDVGGESTRPGYVPISAEEEIERIVPVIKSVKTRFNIPVSLDTCKSRVAQAGIEAGADMINDVWGLKYDKAMAAVIAESGLPCCLVHNRREAVYENFMQEVCSDFMEMIQAASDAGIAGDRIILDPGVGFGKTYEQNLEILNNLQQLSMFGYPILLGCSRKSVIGQALDLPVDERLEGTIVTSAMAVWKGCTFVRVHDVRENARAVRMAEAILHG